MYLKPINVFDHFSNNYIAGFGYIWFFKEIFAYIFLVSWITLTFSASIYSLSQHFWRTEYKNLYKLCVDCPSRIFRTDLISNIPWCCTLNRHLSGTWSGEDCPDFFLIEGVRIIDVNKYSYPDMASSEQFKLAVQAGRLFSFKNMKTE